MSLKCSVLGHAFDDGAVEREREEQGSEVVSTIRETETCTRCGTERVVSENKEVTTLETPSDIVGDDPSEADTEDGETPDGVTGGVDADSADGADGAGPTGQASAADGAGDRVDGAGVASTPSTETAATGADTTPSPPTPEADVAPDPEEDDGVILDAEEEEEADERAPGEWPEENGTGGEEHAVATGAVAEWPEDDDEDDDDWAPETDGETPTEVEPTSTAVTVPEGSFHCPACDFSTPVEGSSLRAGDFCPECHHGSLEHRS